MLKNAFPARDVALPKFNRVEIFHAAWVAYRLARPAIFAAGDETGHRRFLRDLFARLLRTAWANARKQSRNVALTVHDVVGAVRLSDAAKAARLAEINAELQAQDYSDAPTNWPRRAAWRAELARLAA